MTPSREPGRHLATAGDHNASRLRLRVDPGLVSGAQFLGQLVRNRLMDDVDQVLLIKDLGFFEHRRRDFENVLRQRQCDVAG